MKSLPIGAAAAFVLSLLFSAPSYAQQQSPSEMAAAIERMGGFSKAERESIRDYYRSTQRSSEAVSEDKGRGNKSKQQKGNGKDRGKGKQGKNQDKSLPKGLQKKLARGGELPPGWQRKLQPGDNLTAEMLDQAEPLPRELDRVLEHSETVRTDVIKLKDKVVRVARGEGTVLDVIDLIDILEPEQ
ncbi:hypothetical protein [Motiliproteus coralliicola]|nr:hypothetical protein [Motiliproteus coralliicola]